MKTHNAFFSDRIQTLLRDNQNTNQAAGKQAAEFIASAGPWMEMSFKELREMVFPPDIMRSWFVLSDGNCPSCGKSVPMYNWLYDPFGKPWKMTCPHCSADFPKNDFAEYYRSGIDGSGYFSYENADPGLLKGRDGTDFGVDDGNGWVDENGRRYMFIGAYLCHAKWRAQILEGVRRLSFSYVLSGDNEYAYKTAVLLDAIADFWPEYDFYTQGYMYEQRNKSHGYVGYWANSSRDVRDLALSYDQIYESLSNDSSFEDRLGKSFGEFAGRVEERIFLDSLKNIRKIHTNPPETPITVTILKAVLNFSLDEISDDIDKLIEQATRIDGMSGESGLAGYAAIAPRSIAGFLCLFSNTDENFLDDILNKHPKLYSTYRFHIDTWYNSSYYPGIGDTSAFAAQSEIYPALFNPHLPRSARIHRSPEWFAMKLSEFYDDPDFAKTIFLSYKTTESVFDSDYYMSFAGHYEDKLAAILESSGMTLTQSSSNYSQWRLSVLHSGQGPSGTMLAMPYDSGKNHTHHDALSLHIFSKGLNVSPDFGYPPVNYGGWKTKEVKWYRHPASHNQVVIDGKSHINMPEDGDGMFYRYPGFGKNIMFCNGSMVKAMYNSAPEYNGVDRNERLAAIITVGEDDYILDISRTDGGNEHTRYLHGNYSILETSGLSLEQVKMDNPDEIIIRNPALDKSPDHGWSACFRLCEGSNHGEHTGITMKYTSLTSGHAAGTCESWVDITRMLQVHGMKTGNRTVWIPTIFEAAYGPRSQFAGIIEVYDSNPIVNKIKTIETSHDFNFTAAVDLADGSTDYILSRDPESKYPVFIDEPSIGSDALLAICRFNGDSLSKATVCSGTYITIMGLRYDIDTSCSDIEFI